MPRAQAFYEAIFDTRLQLLDMGVFKMALFPPAEVGLALCLHPEAYKPSGTAGPLIYLNGNPDLQTILDRVEGAGGKILRSKTQISADHGFMALFEDTEGNRLGLRSRA